MHEAVKIVAQYFIVLSVLGALYVWLRLDARGKKRFIVQGIVGGVIALVLAEIAKHVYYDPRPFVAGHFTPYFGHSTDNGFPSDHTLLTAFLGFLVLYYRRSWGWALLVLAAIIGAARVIAGVHHAQDIIGAFVFAGLGALLAWLIINLVYKQTPSVQRRQLEKPAAEAKKR